MTGVTKPVAAALERASRLALQRSYTVGEVAGLFGGGRDLGGRLIALTGASSGIGAAAAESLARAGADLILIGRDGERLAEVGARARAFGVVVRCVKADLTDETDTARLVDELLAGGCPDVLINNAGRSIRRSVIDATDRLHDYKRTMAINYFGPVQLTLGLLPEMRRRGDGHIVNVSTWGIVGGAMPKFSAYAASKAALSAFGRSMGAELRGTGVSVTTVYYPLVRTPMIAPTAEYSRLPTLTPEEAAEWLTYSVRNRPNEVMPRYAKVLRRVVAVSSDWADGMISRSGI
ncbi:SDR family NAD(P)-dependent oxidoreductase [Williamsia sterculiae]|uniref:Short-chain dehydrogenase n=1 Tax=Williamsia sterculiae TaxID=1344003 RepID=A0A1N7HAD5_9NOCA|nr:SDR family NAD(P)-dependent oxidoreductase [Williamsia sterculiae]SIS21608.1 Short-chain dehydrogenase [Williamsia sterculiae]